MNHQLVFRTNKSKILLHTIGSGLLVLLGIHMLPSCPQSAWFVVIIFGLCTLSGVVRLFMNSVSLRLDEEGFESIGTFKRTRFLWKDLESIRMGKIRTGKIGYISVISIDYKSGHPQQIQTSRLLTGMDAALTNIYNVPLNDLCRILQEWHELYRSAPNRHESS